ncbi:MAG: sensor histidine kinase [Ktedonobacteraceae bacterium]
MKKRFTLPALSLRSKLMLSFLGVALGAIVTLAIVVSLAVQNYFDSVQRDQLRSQAEYIAHQIGYFYASRWGSWDNAPPLEPGFYGSLIITDTHGGLVNCSQPRDVVLIQCDDPALKQALGQALQGQEINGRVQGTTEEGNTFTGIYISVPLHDGGQANGQIIGAMLLAEPEQYPQGFSPNDFLENVNQAILVTGLLVAIVVLLFSLLLARSLTRPLASLTRAAEQMKSGNYAQRVASPNSRDELERLTVTFNDMADTIASDIAELRHQEQLRRDLIANIAHDLATPLTAIQGFSEALADNVISNAQERQETAQLIGREVQRLRRLVGDMQQMTALESARLQLDLAPLDMHSLVDETLAVIKGEYEQAGINVYNKIDPATPPVLADSDRIIQVLLNLFDNARRYTPAGGQLSVEAQPEGKMLRVCVSDTGSGINPADLPHIFERFYRVDRARTATTGGSGLGLAIVKAIISAHGGSISAESKPGQGTHISFSLPLASSV